MASLTEDEAEKVKAYSAATDNVGLFFGEDIFFAIGSIVLIQQMLSTYGYNLAPLELALWAIPTAIAAFLIHCGAPAAVRPQAGAARPMITLHWLYALAGAMFAAFALLSALDRSNKKRFGNAAFWGLMALSLLGRRTQSAISATACWCSASQAWPASASSAAAIRRPPATRNGKTGRTGLATGCSCPP